ncbi:MAG: transposase [Desulfuromonadales bacterium]
MSGGVRSGKRGRGAENKTKVAIAVERRGKRLGRVRMQVIDDCSASQLITFVKNNVAPGNQISTDGWKGYCGLKKAGYDHQKVLPAHFTTKRMRLLYE